MNNSQYTLAHIAELIQAELIGDPACVLQGVASLLSADESRVSFLVSAQYLQDLSQTKAGAVILSPDYVDSSPTHCLVVKNPELAFAQLAELFSSPISQQGIDKTAVVPSSCDLAMSASIAANCVLGKRVTLGERSIIMPNVVIGDDVFIGADCVVYPGASVGHNVVIGDRCIIHPGVVIGADGFGFVQDEDNNWVKIPQLGAVLIGDDVEIGANTTIDRGALDDTVIEDGVKLDNQIQVGHNVHIGAHTIIAGSTGIAGSVKIGSHCMIGGLVGINDHVELADGVIITGMTQVMKSISQPGVYSSGTGMLPNKKWRKTVARLHQIDDIAKRLKFLEKKKEVDNYG